MALLRGLRAQRRGARRATRDVRVVVVRGAGQAFCSGMDLREMAERQDDAADPESGVTADAPAGRALAPSHHRDGQRRRHTRAGASWRCTAISASPPSGARFGMPLARIGLLVPFALGQKLVEIIGPRAHARRFSSPASRSTRRRAYEIGMVHRVVPPAEIETATYALARTIADNAPLSLSGMKAGIAARGLAPRAGRPRRTSTSSRAGRIRARTRRKAPRDAREAQARVQGPVAPGKDRHGHLQLRAPRSAARGGEAAGRGARVPARERGRGRAPSATRTWGGHDREFSRKVGARGWIGMTWPKQYGGHERSALERYVRARGDAGGGRAGRRALGGGPPERARCCCASAPRRSAQRFLPQHRARRARPSPSA